jgi:TonB-dependent SusC/RagA subfamily outer membrane receptor
MCYIVVTCKTIKYMIMKLKVVLALLFVFCLIQPSFAQKDNKKIKITGTVVDANRNPLEGIMILVDQIKTEVKTNENGIFKVKVPPTAKTITAFSGLNGVKEMPINGQTTLNIVLDDVVSKTSQPVKQESEAVDVGYGTARKDQVLNNVKNVNGTKDKTRRYTDIYEMIRGEVPGATVTGKTVRLQKGPNSFYGSPDPLFIIDGVEVSQIDFINPADVGSISVLIGPAASIYGTRGNNGVLLIKTKSK